MCSTPAEPPHTRIGSSTVWTGLTSTPSWENGSTSRFHVPTISTGDFTPAAGVCLTDHLNAMSTISTSFSVQGLRVVLIPLVSASALWLSGCGGGTRSPAGPDGPAVTVAYDALDYRSGVFYSGDRPFTGVATVTHPDGKPAKEIQFRNGRFHGVVKEWAENGTLIVETHFDNGQRHGKNTYWFPDGRLQKEQLYQYDKVVKEKKHY
jgi:hypothetical protein